MAERLVVRPKVNKRDSMGIKAQIQNNNNNRQWQHNVPRLKKARKRTVNPNTFCFGIHVLKSNLNTVRVVAKGGNLYGLILFTGSQPIYFIQTPSVSLKTKTRIIINWLTFKTLLGSSS